MEDIDSDQEDHIYDECRYVLMENPLSPRQIQKETVLRDDPLDLDSHKSRTRVMRVYGREMFSFAAQKRTRKARRCPQGMKAPVGLLSRRLVCEANDACLARQGHGDFDALDPRIKGCSPLIIPKKKSNRKKASRCA